MVVFEGMSTGKRLVQLEVEGKSRNAPDENDSGQKPEKSEEEPPEHAPAGIPAGAIRAFHEVYLASDRNLKPYILNKIWENPIFI
jgi:hypothetical protein